MKKTLLNIGIFYSKDGASCHNLSVSFSINTIYIQYTYIKTNYTSVRYFLPKVTYSVENNLWHTVKLYPPGNDGRLSYISNASFWDTGWKDVKHWKKFNITSSIDFMRTRIQFPKCMRTRNRGGASFENECGSMRIRLDPCIHWKTRQKIRRQINFFLYRTFLCLIICLLAAIFPSFFLFLDLLDPDLDPGGHGMWIQIRFPDPKHWPEAYRRPKIQRT
jgi:hypothetical protein